MAKKCELLDTCLFFNDRMSGYPTSIQLTKEQFCLSDNSRCARYIVYKALGRDRVPDDLYPREIERAKRIIGEG